MSRQQLPRRAVTRCQRRVQGRPPEQDAGAAMLMVIMLVLVVGSLGALITASVVQQVRPTAFGQKNTRTVFAAEAGVQATLGQFRNITYVDATGAPRGNPTSLPCSLGGAAGLPAEQLQYAVTVQYFSDDPTGRSQAWRDANDLDCTASGVATTPTFGLITARGSAKGVPGFAASDGNRTIESLYTFNVVNRNVNGGLFYNRNAAFCLEAEGTTVGSTIRYVPASTCSTNQHLQRWSYDTDHRIKLAATVSDSSPGLCVTGVFSGNAQATLTTCNPARNDQLFAFNQGEVFRGQNSGNTGPGSTCLWAGSTSISTSSRLHSGYNCDEGSNHAAWRPDFKVGAGKASKTTDQIVSYQQFGRCFDVTNEQVGFPYMILWPCKQDPRPGSPGIFWNHRWYYDEVPTPQTIRVREFNDPTRTYCLTTPAATAAQPAHVFLQPCVLGAESQRFVRTGDTGLYATSYTFTDAYGRCVSVGPTSYDYAEIASIVVAPCTGGAEQKWNAPPNAITAAVTNTVELVDAS
jgi:Tfp pilus assembly protein PilX